MTDPTMRGEVKCGGGRYGKGGMGGMEYARARVERARDERAKEVREESGESGRARVREGRTDAEQR